VPRGGTRVEPEDAARGRLASENTGVAPNYDWRHRFKTLAREAGIDPGIRDAIQGHVPRTEGEAYGEVTVRAIATAISRFPRITLS
jgi:hypothetical protein